MNTDQRTISFSFGRQAILLCAVLTPLFVLGSLIHNRTPNVDVVAAALPAWQLSENGTVWLDDHSGTNPWIVGAADGHHASDRPPGLVALAVPGYVIGGSAGFSIAPAAVTAVLITLAFAVGLLLLLRTVVPSSFALWACLVFVLGTSTWHFSASQLWPHGPGQLLAVLALLALSTGRTLAAGWAFALGLLVRPVTSVMAATIGLAEAVQRRTPTPVLKIGLPTAGALLALIGYNALVFGSPSISGGYSAEFAQRAVQLGLVAYLRNAWEAIGGSSNGIFTWSPFLLVCLAGIRATWKQAPPWMRSSAIAAVVYILVHSRLNRASAGLVSNYRYPLEALTLASPLLALAGWWIWRRRGLYRSLLVGSALLSVAIQTLSILLVQCWPDPEALMSYSCGFFW